MRRRLIAPKTPTTANGNHTQQSSETSTGPAFAAKSSAPIGDTRIGRNGKKKRRFENGMKKPTPLPPLVIASRTPCDSNATQMSANANRNETSFFAKRVYANAANAEKRS